MEYSAINSTIEESALNRLDNQMNWYDTKSIFNQKRYKQCKYIQFGITAIMALLPMLGCCLGNSNWLGFAEAFLAIILGVLGQVSEMNQYYFNWHNYRATCEVLRHEKELYNAKAGHYNIEYPEKLLAERLEMCISTEHTKWNTKTFKHVIVL